MATRGMSGAYRFNKVFLCEVAVDPDALIGEEGDGWAVARTMLSSERSANGGGTSARPFQDLIGAALSTSGEGKRLDSLWRQSVSSAYIRERVLDLQMRRAQEENSGSGASSIGKLMYSEHARLSSSAALEVLRMTSVAGRDDRAAVWRDRFLFSPSLRIGGGADEIQRNVIGERGLGFPREPMSPDKPS